VLALTLHAAPAYAVAGLWQGQSVLNVRRRARADEMGRAMSMFTSGFEGELFNHPGTPLTEAVVDATDLIYLTLYI